MTDTLTRSDRTCKQRVVALVERRHPWLELVARTAQQRRVD
jgi:hypothetical protein